MPLEMINKFTSVVCSKSVSAAPKWPDNSADAVPRASHRAILCKHFKDTHTHSKV